MKLPSPFRNLSPRQRERYLTLRIVEIRGNGVQGVTYCGPIGAVEAFMNNLDCDVTVLDPRRIPWSNKSVSSPDGQTRRTS